MGCSAIARPTVKASLSVDSMAWKLESGSAPRASRSLLKKQRAAAAAVTSKISSSP